MARERDGTEETDVGAFFSAHREVVAASADRLGGAIARVGGELARVLAAGGTLFVFGNGGSAAQASHLAGELLGRYRSDRAPLPCVALASDLATVSCIGNDFGFDRLFARQVEALVGPGDAAIGLTTSGRSANVLNGLAAARERGALTVALTGEDGLAAGAADYVLAVPSRVTAHVQEVHLMIIHCWCEGLEGP